MSIFNGKLRRVDKLTGNLTDKKPQLRIRITPMNHVPKVTLSSRGGFSGAWERAGRFFAGAARPLSILYRFLAGSGWIRSGFSAKAGTAPAQEIEADSSPVANVDAPLTAQPAQEVTAHTQPHASVWTQLAAYNRAAAVTLSKIFTGKLARAVAAPGVLAKYRKRMDLERVSKAEAAGSAIMESRFNRFTSENEAIPATAPTTETAINTAFTVESEAPAAVAPATYMGVGSAANIVRTAAPHTFASPIVVNGVLKLRQVYSVTRTGDILQVR